MRCLQGKHALMVSCIDRPRGGGGCDSTGSILEATPSHRYHLLPPVTTGDTCHRLLHFLYLQLVLYLQFTSLLTIYFYTYNLLLYLELLHLHLTSVLTTYFYTYDWRSAMNSCQYERLFRQVDYLTPHHQHSVPWKGAPTWSIHRHKTQSGLDITDRKRVGVTKKKKKPRVLPVITKPEGLVLYVTHSRCGHSSSVVRYPTQVTHSWVL